MVRIRVEETKYGQYEAHLQLYVGHWFDEPCGRIGRGNSVGGAIAAYEKKWNLKFPLSVAI